MSPLKFRAWDKHPEKQCWVKNGKPFTLDDLMDSEEPYGMDMVYMQSTGLFDRTGKEIFESDILRGKETGVVEWFQQDGAWGVRVESMAWSYLLSCNMPDKHEVIGNIYENPDLLPV